jgi:hypothetical protein
MSKKYVIVGDRDLGLIHPAIEEFYSNPENIKSKFPPWYMPPPKARYVLIHGRVLTHGLVQEVQELMAVPGQYFVASLETGDFSELGVTGLDALLEASKAYGVSQSVIEKQWRILEAFDSHLDKLHMIQTRHPPYPKTHARNFKARRRRR